MGKPELKDQEKTGAATNVSKKLAVNGIDFGVKEEHVAQWFHQQRPMQ